MRAHYLYDTVEVRICDMPTRLEHSVALAALIQALTAQLYLLYRHNMAWRTYPSALIEENKWRACRYGRHARLIDFGEQRERPFPELLDELLAFVSEAAALLGTEKEVAAVRKILEEGTSSDHQLRIFKETNDARAVVRWLVDETMAGLGPNAGTVQRSA